MLLIAALVAVAGGQIVSLRWSIVQDTWLALLSGRLVAEHGLPHHAITVYASGRPWIDQQWLAQLAMYQLARIGGIKLVGFVNAGLLVFALAGATMAARRLGAAAGRVMWVLPPALWCILVGQIVRTQDDAYVLFVATVYVLARQRAAPSSRIALWSLPLLVLWGNVHGSASLGAALIMLRGLVLLWQRRRELRTVGSWSVPALLVLAPAPLLLVTPYGTDIVSYYSSTLLNGGFRQLVAEWLPVYVQPVLAVGLALLSALVLWALWRGRTRLHAWDTIVLLALMVAGISVVRNIVWFGFAAIVLVPPLLTPPAGAGETASGTRVRTRLNRFTLIAACLFTVGAGAAILVRPESRLEPSYPPHAVAVVSGQLASNPTLRIFADERYADWLMWRIPDLVGHMAYNASFELLSRPQLTRVVLFKAQAGRDWTRAARGYGLLALDVGKHPGLRRYYGHVPGARVLFTGHGLELVALPGHAA